MELETLAQQLLAALQSGQLSLLSALPIAALIGVVALLRKVLAPRVPFFSEPLGIVTLNVVCSGIAAGVTAVFAGAPLSLALLGTSLFMSFKAAGGWTLLKHLTPYLLKLLERFAPGLLALARKLLPMIGNSTAAKAEASAAGDKAAKDAQPTSLEDLVNK